MCMLCTLVNWKPEYLMRWGCTSIYWAHKEGYEPCDKYPIDMRAKTCICTGLGKDKNFWTTRTIWHIGLAQSSVWLKNNSTVWIHLNTKLFYKAFTVCFECTFAVMNNRNCLAWPAFVPMPAGTERSCDTWHYSCVHMFLPCSIHLYNLLFWSAVELCKWV